MKNNKRSFEAKKLDEVLHELTEQKNIKRGLTKVRAEQAWGNVMGKGILSYTKEILFKNSTLFVSITSAPLREELLYNKNKIIANLNEFFKEEVIKKIVFR